MELSSKRVLVTGGSGFLGQHVVAALERHGCRDVIVVRKARHDLTHEADVARLFEEKRRAISDGKLIPFAGPLKDNAGATKLREGTALTHEQLMAINWYVDGVDGSVPK